MVYAFTISVSQNRYPFQFGQFDQAKVVERLSWTLWLGTIQNKPGGT
jgi:hypothetical protein